MQQNSIQQQEIEKVLGQSGFSDKEVFVYMALLELGIGTVSEIARKAGIGRTYAYAILDGLAGKGLVSVSGKKPKQEYLAESPRNLVTYLEARLESDKKTVSSIKTLLPELISLHTVEDRPKIRFYEGILGLKEVYEDTLNAKGLLRGFVKYDELHATLPDYFPEYYKRRNEKGIFGKGIATDTPLARSRKGNDSKEARELVLVSKELFDISPEFDIYDNKVMIASWREKLGVIIESGEIADAMKKIFDLAWIGAKSLEKH